VNGGDGFDRLVVANMRPDGQVDPLEAFSASVNGGDGFDRLIVANMRPDGQIDPLEAFSASANGGDGFDRLGLANLRPDGQSDPLEAFSASTNGADGWALSGEYILELSPLSPLAFFGGLCDGFDRQLFPPNSPIDPSVSYAAWRTVYFSPAEIGGGLGDPHADPDGDGWANALEYALDSLPTVPDADGRITFSLSGYLTVTARKATYQPRVQFGADTSSNVAPWDAVSGFIIEDTATNFVARDTQPIGAKPRNFLRLILDLLP
jgi:hypothetical protein